MNVLVKLVQSHKEELGMTQRKIESDSKSSRGAQQSKILERRQLDRRVFQRNRFRGCYVFEGPIYRASS